MRIKVKSEDANFSIRIPSVLCFNWIGAAIASKTINIGISHANVKTKLPYSSMRKLLKAAKQSRHLLQGQPLVEVDSADGTKVEIWI